ncbi:MAG: nitroreductase family protein [Oscillospiraceae bacterium]|nr:nitroreductase family protein [Oscillospiraceae bacterium]
MVQIQEAACTGCGTCVRDCPGMCLSLAEGKARYQGPCITCGHCVAICPTGAVAIPEYEMDDIQPVNPPLIPFPTLLNFMKSRRSIRHYQDQKIEQEKLNNLIQAGRYAPTAMNLQACRFIVVQEKLPELKRIAWNFIEEFTASGQAGSEAFAGLLNLRQEQEIDYLFRNAPAVLYIAAERVWDAGLAAQNIELAAVSQGLGVLHNGYLCRASANSAEAKELLQPNGKPLAICMLLGYPDVRYIRTAPRKKADVRFL